MRKAVLLLVVGFLLTPIWEARGEDILGCPNGIAQGTIWPRFIFKYIDATEKWSPGADRMIDIKDGPGVTQKEVYKYDFRLGYGLLHNLDIGANLKYANSRVDKTTRQGKVVKFDESAFTYLWLSGKYIFLDKAQMGVLDYLKLNLGAAYGFALAKSDKYLQAGLSAGDNQAKVGLLYHGGMFDDLFEFAGHLLYRWRGSAAQADGFQRSEQEMADTIEYLFKLERELGEYVGLGAGVSGWFGVQEDKNLLNSSGVALRPYQHNLHVSLEIFPLGSLDYEKRKVFVHLAVPYSVRAMVAPDYVLGIGAMWAF